MGSRRTTITALALVVGLALAPQAGQALQPEHDRIPNAVPAASTPAVLDGEVLGITQVGSTVIASGNFTRVSEPGGGEVARTNVFGFDAASGKLSTTFVPAVNGTVEAVLPGPTSGTVYLAGAFNRVNGVASSRVALVNVSNGQAVAGFRAAAFNGRANTIERVGNRLIVGGFFTSASGVSHQGLASISATTGTLDPYINLQFTGHHNDTGSGAQGAVGVRDLVVRHAGDRLVVIGNFKRAEGIVRDQVAMINLGESSATLDLNWKTQRYEPYCFKWAFDTYMRSVSISPDDTFFVIATTGGHNAGTLCDTAARFNFSDGGQTVQPAWISDSGGDTLWATAITEKAVFVGGHQRWMNNPNGSDFAAAGAVPRPGLAALNIDSGVPIKWNPGRNPRGAAVYAIHPTPQGLWLGSDTEWIGNRDYRRPRIAYFPLAGGLAEASDVQAGLPGSVYLAAGGQQGNVLYRVNAGGPALSAVDGGPDWSADNTTSSPWRNLGSVTATWAPSAARDSSLPSSAPTSLFDSERSSLSDVPRMSWSFPTTAGLPLQVRLYFANRNKRTGSVGQRVFDVALEGKTVLDNFDIVAAVGNQRGMMRSFDITSDNFVNIDFSHVVDHPLINGIEILRRDLPPPSALSTIQFDGTTAGSATAADSMGVDWSQMRGAFLVGNILFHGWSDGRLYKRQFTPTSIGDPTLIDPYNDPYWSDVDTGSGSTFRGKLSAFYGQISNVTGLFYADDRIYYTLNGHANLYWRGFNVDSGIVGPTQVTANGGLSWSNTSGLFAHGNTLYVVNKANGNLMKVNFVNGVPSGTFTSVDTSNDWRARALFIGQGVAPNQQPTARFSVNCVKLVCNVDASESSDPEGAELTYQWDFGDSGTETGVRQSHEYSTDGSYTIALTVTDPRNGTDTTTRAVTVQAGTASSISFVAASTSNQNTTTPTVTAPAEVEAGDQLVLFGSGTSLGVPDGWALVSSRFATGMESHVWTKRATAADAGAPVVLPTTPLAKTVLVLGAYRGVDAASPVAAVESNTDGSTADHVSPTITAPENAFVLQLWSDKSGTTTNWTLPGTVTERARDIGTGSGRKSAVFADSGGGVGAGQAGGVTATTDAPSGRAINWTLALRSTS